MIHGATQFRRALRGGAGRASLALAAGVAFTWGATAPAWAADVRSDAADAAAATTADASAAAQPGEGSLSEVVVTARRRVERLQDVPISISQIGAAAIVRQKLTKLQDFAQDLPNFTPNTLNPRTSSLSIRGVGGVVGGSDGSESGAGLIVDDVFYTYVGFAFAPLYDVAAVEVARGPQGTLLGKNTTVGAVIVRNNAPSFDPESQAEISVGNYDSTRITASSTGPLIGDTLAYRLSFYREDNGGFWPNNPVPIPDNDRATSYGDNTNRWGLRGQLLWQPTSNISDRLIVDGGDTSEFNNYTSVISSLFTHYANGAPVRTFETFMYQMYGLTNLPTSEYASSQTNPSPFQTAFFGVSNELNADFGWANLTSVTGYRNDKLWPRNSQGYYGYYVESLGYDNNNSIYSEELRLASKPSKIFDWTVGAYGLIDSRWSKDRVIYGKDASSWLLTPLPANFATQVNPATFHNPAILNDLEDDRLGTALTHSIAAFGQGTLHLWEGVDLTGGVRFTHETRSGNVIGSYFIGAGGTPNSQLSASDLALRTSFVNTALRGTFNAAQIASYYGLPDSVANDAVSWLVNPSWKITPNILLYASAAQGEKSGAINTVAQSIAGTTVVPGSSVPVGGIQPLITKPEVALDFELGVKTTWFNQRLLLNVNLYQNTITDFQGAVLDTTTFPGVAYTYLGNIPKVQLKGVEAEAYWQANDWLQFHLAGALSAATYLSYPDAGLPADQLYGTSNPLYTKGLPYSSLSGTSVPSVAPWTVNGDVSWDKPAGQILGHDVALFGFVNVAVTGKTRYSDSRSTIYYGQDTYALTNASIGVHRADGRWALSVWVRNLADTKYVNLNGIALNTAPGGTTYSGYGPSTYSPGDPRTFGATLSTEF
jgi:iron complex outermembrane receptor protein